MMLLGVDFGSLTDRRFGGGFAHGGLYSNNKEHWNSLLRCGFRHEKPKLELLLQLRCGLSKSLKVFGSGPGKSNICVECDILAGTKPGIESLKSWIRPSLKGGRYKGSMSTLDNKEVRGKCPSHMKKRLLCSYLR